MSRDTRQARGWLAVALALGLVLSPAIGSATTAVVQTVAISGLAVANGTGDARIQVLVYSPLDGSPISNLGSTIASNSSGITLPTGWALTTLLVSPGGCTMTPTEFFNNGSGIYRISVRPFPGNPACVWKSGDYVYAIRLTNPGGTTFLGSALGVLSIP